MQGPAGACLREPIDFLDNLDGPNPLMMGKQKYCFLEHFWRTANKYERKRSTQHGDATKVGHAISAASNPAVQRLMDADPSLTASAAVTKVGHAISAASNLARRILHLDGLLRVGDWLSPHTCQGHTFTVLHEL